MYPRRKLRRRNRGRQIANLLLFARESARSRTVNLITTTDAGPRTRIQATSPIIPYVCSRRLRELISEVGLKRQGKDGRSRLTFVSFRLMHDQFFGRLIIISIIHHSLTNNYTHGSKIALPYCKSLPCSSGECRLVANNPQTN